ncbi:hypothetical protein M728_005880 (plasmid) [Ensifer sp. WSM1721]|uniref:hypothetical protein n=1 Tax=Ensifer sp. WSM1721 TaxID=1041159 RepID=UPI000479D8D0|nr:hypothetical protein [Ensifer sp. WSM1721]
MADSDNSRTLSTVTRGDFHSFVAASLPTPPELAITKSRSSDPRGEDHALALWHQWCAAWQRLCESNLRQQQLERSLFPVCLPPPLEQGAGSRTYSEALEAEDRASIAEERAAETLWETPAVSVAGAAAKLHAAMTKWQPSPTSQEEPWPQIRIVIADLLQIDMASVASGRNRLSTPELQPEFQSS